jgi:magnesium and cobalt exporter, CNNM family
MDTASILSILGRLLLVVLLVALNGFFVAAEFAMVKIRGTQLDPLIQKGHRRAGIAGRIIKNLDASLSAAQLGITLASLGLGWIGEPVFAALLQPLMQWLHVESDQLRHTIAFLVGFSAITFLHITAGEQAPKWLAIQKPLPTTLWISYPMLCFARVSYPFIWILNNTSLWILRRLGIEPAGEGEMIHSEEELRLLFSAAHKHTAGTPIGKDIVLNALDLGRRLARDVMRPRQEITVLDTEASIAECLDLAEKTRYSRFPLCQNGDLDQTVGVVHFKDLFALRSRAKKGADLVSAARKLIYIPETARLETLLQLFLDRKLHLAIVVDEYGGTAGMVTLENILEELVGQIQDEFDQEKPMLVKTGGDRWEVLGALPLHELEELVGESLQEEGLTTTSGWVTHRLGVFPKVGDTLRAGNCELTVEEVEDRRVARLSVRKV